MNTGFPQSEINIEALENVKTRLFQLQESILFFLRTELHSKFNVLIAKYLHLTNLLNDPHNTLLQSYIVFPNEPPANDQQVQNLSVLLRTKLFPELEQEVDDRIKEGSIPGLATNGGNTAEERRILQALKVRIMMHDTLCRSADEIFENQRDTVDTKFRYESDGDGEDENTREAAPNTSTTESTATDGVVAGGKLKTSSAANKDKTNILPLDDFAIKASDNASSSVRYMSDWGGTLHDIDGYGSEAGDEAEDEELGDFDDSYFEKRRHEGQDDDGESSESESEVEQVEYNEDTFMEVSTGSQAIMDANSTHNSVSMAENTFDDGNGSGEEDMEEVM
ncbi:hypothetical protein BGZ65_003087 [Modicella reniformis]|uniref:Mediator of RNA polymerase II transcription subunit 8 n=1 Tax=Modicella reniformis TaxID=1440133 RepID=A0A9P6MLS7_9FUNG|nr:hypothetical protein BGZ65_003087 [Modicella reniformis]